ncbi:MAG: hypothetical protein IPP07_05145 [Holophagales bacterium]|nr:hypothetical protein [Holophagales bacterium]
MAEPDSKGATPREEEDEDEAPDDETADFADPALHRRPGRVGSHGRSPLPGKGSPAREEIESEAAPLPDDDRSRREVDAERDVDA